MNIIEKIFGTHSENELKRIYPIVDRIEALGPEMEALSDEELRGKTKEFKERLKEGETLDDILPEAYAVVREGAYRSLGMRHYRVQLIGGIILHQGRIAEMRTGEGKTLVSTLPAYLNALDGKGVHIVTVNDYLAKRDAEWMGKVHEFLGLKVGVVLNEMNNDERREAYNCDITYVTNNELGFDYLRDNMVIYKEQLVQRGLHYAVIDEVDSVLIDEARTPLIISGQSGKSTRLYEACDVLARQLERGEASGEFSKMNAIMGEEIEETGDFIVNEKEKNVSLTEDGVKEKKIGDDKVIVLYMPGIHESIAGLIASKLKEAFYRPTLVFADAENGQGLKGSGRSIETYNMFDKLCEHKDLFVKVGGHPMAAGFTITREALEPLREALNRDCNLTDADLVEKLYVDESCAIKQLTLPLYEELAKLEPYGTANARPLFGIVKMGIRSIKMVGNEGQYARCTFVDGNGTRINGMVFRGKELLDNIKVWFGDKECDKILKGLQNHALIDILYHMKKNEFNGTVSIQMEPVSIRKSVYYETSK